MQALCLLWPRALTPCCCEQPAVLTSPPCRRDVLCLPCRAEVSAALLPAQCGLCSEPIDFLFPPCLLWVCYCHYIN